MQESLERLKMILRDLNSVLIAFSGGVDSSFLVHIAHEVLGERAQAITFLSPLLAGRERDRAIAFCQERGIRHILLKIDPLVVSQIQANPPDRCYHCKKYIYSQGLATAKMIGVPHLIDGTQLSDASEHRPGRLALKELAIQSPLATAAFTKDRVRQLSRERGLSSWNLPPMACLASRIPHGTPIQPQDLARVEAAEEFLFRQGFHLVRVRDHQSKARIELAPEELAGLTDAELRQRVVDHLKSLGYTAVTLDLEGYRTGTMDQLD